MVGKNAILGGITALGAVLGLVIAGGPGRIWQAGELGPDGAADPCCGGGSAVAPAAPVGQRAGSRFPVVPTADPVTPASAPSPAASLGGGAAAPPPRHADATAPPVTPAPVPAAATTIIPKQPVEAVSTSPPPDPPDLRPHDVSEDLPDTPAPLAGTEEDSDGGPGDDGAAGDMSAREARSAVASVLLGAVAAKTRPSQLLGEGGSGSLLGNTLDGFWGLGQQEALQFIVEGKVPDSAELGRNALRVAASSANQQVARLADDAAQYGQDHGIKFLRNLETEAEWFPGRRPAIEVRTIDALFQSEALDHTVFLEAGLRSDFDDTVANVGLGYRWDVPDSPWMFGINAFYDREFPIGHERMSIGLEASTPDFTLFGNRYVALSGWAEKNVDIEERPLSGWDVGIAGQMPGIEDLRVSLSAFHWDQKTEADLTGLKLMADYDVSPGLQFGTTFAADNAGDVEAGVRVTWQFGADLFGGDEAMTAPDTARRLAFVNRENGIRTESREIPHDYSIQFLDSAVDNANQSSLGFTLSGAPRAARYSYTIVSSGGGAKVTGSGLVEADVQPVSGVDVSGLADGTLTLTLRVVSRKGATGPPVTAQIVKSTAAAITVAISPLGGQTANTIPLRFEVRFSQPVEGFDLADLAVSNGTAANLQTADGVTWTFDVTPAGQGAVGVQISAGAVTNGTIGNDDSNVSTIVYDTDAPSGYSVAFLMSPPTAAQFRISGAEIGASYSYSIESSGGGTPVTGTGAIESVTQQVTGIDLSGLADGTLTLSLTLADALGNTGAPAIDHMAKDAAPPLIANVTPPANGNYDDL